MRILINNSDVRKYRQLSKQLDVDSFEGHVRTVQDTALYELLKSAMFSDMFQYLDIGFDELDETFEIVDNTTIKVIGYDASLLVDYALKLNDEVFVIIENAVFDATDTLLTVTGYDLPTTITSFEYAQENKYVKLLNGTIYKNSQDYDIKFTGLRAFLSWHFMSSYLSDGNLKQSDVGNINILGDMFSGASGSQLREAKNEYLQNANREGNKIIDYLDQENADFELWQSTAKENLTSMEFIII